MDLKTLPCDLFNTAVQEVLKAVLSLKVKNNTLICFYFLHLSCSNSITITANQTSSYIVKS